ncbi:cpt, partial [Symbiodinium natans]
MHAREPAGLTVLLYFLGHLLDKFKSGDPDAVYILNMREIWFVPFVNPDGYVANKGLRNKVIRKNRRPTCRSPVEGGVDINRNFAVHWSSSFGGCNEEHGGTQPFSEPETQAFKKICEENEFKTAMNFHAYGSMLTHPYNWATADLMPAEDKKVYQEIARVFGYKKFGPAIKTVGYTTSGESDDWMYSARHIISMSPEVGPESGGFWPPSSQIGDIDARNFDRTLYIAGKAGMELHTEWVQQPLPPAGPDLSSLGDPPRSLLKLRIANRGLTSSHGKVLQIAVRGVVAGEAEGDVGFLTVMSPTLLDSVESRQTLTADKGILAWKVDSIPSRSSREFRMYLSRSSEPAAQRSVQTCVAEAFAESVCQCTELIELPGSSMLVSKQSARKIYALPHGRSSSAGEGINLLCAAAANGAQLPAQDHETPPPANVETAALPTRMPTIATTPTSAPLVLPGLATPLGLSSKPSQGTSDPVQTQIAEQDAAPDTASATWILMALGATLVAMCMCMAMQPFIMPRRVAKRAPSAVDYEQIPSLQVPRPED